MSKKDCFYAISIVLLIEYFVFDWTYRFGADKNLTDHVSFAGTIIGIILAVVAIFYSFIQAESQARSSSAISEQIGSLRDVVKQIDSSKNEFSLELDRIDAIASKLDVVNSGIVSSHKKIDEVGDALRSLDLKVQPSGQVPNSLKKSDLEEIAKVLLNRSSFEADLCGYALNRYLIKTKNKTFKLTELMPNYFVSPLRESKPDCDLGEALAYAYQTISTLRAFDLLTYDDNRFTVSDELAEVLPSIAESTKRISMPWVKAAVEKIDAIA